MMTHKKMFERTQRIAPRKHLSSFGGDFTDWLIQRTLPSLIKNMRHIPLILYRTPPSLQYGTKHNIYINKIRESIRSSHLNVFLRLESFFKSFQISFQNNVISESRVDSVYMNSSTKLSFLQLFNNFFSKQVADQTVPQSLNFISDISNTATPSSYSLGIEKEGLRKKDLASLSNRANNYHQYTGINIAKKNVIKNIIDNICKIHSSYSQGLNADNIHELLFKKNFLSQRHKVSRPVNETEEEYPNRGIDLFARKRTPLALRDPARFIERFKHLKKANLETGWLELNASGGSRLKKIDPQIMEGNMALKALRRLKRPADYQPPYLFPPEMKLAMPQTSEQSNQNNNFNKINKELMPPPPPPQSASSTELDISKITDKVYDEIQRKIRISRERRGL
jgi:hypothetical protein